MESLESCTQDSEGEYTSMCESFYFEKKALHLTPIQIHQCLSLSSKSTPISQTTALSLDSFINSFSGKCHVIITSKSKFGIHKNKCTKGYKYFALRILDDYNTANVQSDSTIEQDTTDNSLTKQFSLLSFSTSKSEGNTQHEDQNNCTQRHISIPLKEAAQFILEQIGILHQGNQNITINSSNHVKKSVAANKNKSTRASITGGLINLSTSVFNKASNALTSILASYDLADNFVDNDVSGNGSNCDDEYQDNDDDYVISSKQSCYVDYHDENDDDAIRTKIAQQKVNTQLFQQQMQKQRLLDSTVLLETDSVWNTYLVIDCWLLILDYVRICLSRTKDGYLDSEYDHFENELHHDQIVHLSSSISSASISGILLYRWGDSKLSFHSFCKQAGTSMLSRLRNDKDATKPMPSLFISSMHYPVEKVASILVYLSLGTSSDLMLAALVETKNAVVCAGGDIVALYPTHEMNNNILDVPSLSLLPSSSSNHQNAITVHDADIAVFKLCTAIQSLELRIESLTHQAEKMKDLALTAKQKKQSTNTSSALMYMKRNQIIMNEIDKSYASLLNLESGLQNLKRARSDAQVVKAYEVMNETMKLLRKETEIETMGEEIDEFIS